jgi:hypothetical protein
LRDIALIHYIIWLAAFLAAAIAGPPAYSNDLPDGMVAVHYAFEIEGSNAVDGQSFCMIDKDCQIGFDFDAIKLTLRLHNLPQPDRLEISCGARGIDCQFDIYNSAIDLDRKRSIQILKVYETENEGNGFRSRYPMGTILLHYRRDESKPDCRSGQPLAQ